MKIELLGLRKVRSKGKIYYYAWRGGPRLRGEPGTPAFFASYNEAVAGRAAPDKSRFKSLVTLYQGSDDYKKAGGQHEAQLEPLP